MVPGRVLDVYSTHFTGARPDGLVEDFHGLGLIFEAEPEERSLDVAPHVVEVGRLDRRRGLGAESTRRPASRCRASPRTRSPCCG